MEAVARLQDEVPSLALNRLLPGGGRKGFISSSINYLYLMEALSILGITDAPVLKIAMSYPLNAGEIASFARGLDRVYVVEELEGFIEFQAKRLLYDSGIRVPIIGKDVFRPTVELDVDLIVERLSTELRVPPPGRTTRAIELSRKLAGDLPPRQGSFCTGCPHRATLYSIVKATDRKAVFAGDIGCYTLSCLPPFAPSTG